MEIEYEENTLEIHSETFNADFDDIQFEPEVEDDSDEEYKEMFGL